VVRPVDNRPEKLGPTKVSDQSKDPKEDDKDL
jgi:hypothetical protein